MSPRKIAIVTGGNKGIGFAIVKGLCEKFAGDVYLTARNITRGQEAVAKLKTLGFNPLFHQLDITNEESVSAFRDYIKTNNILIDVLVNNAGVFASPTLSMGEQAEINVMVNYFGTLKVCQGLFPFLRENARVVNISSSSGRLLRIPGTDIQAKFKDPNLSIEGLNKLMKQYIQDAKDNTYQSKGWGENAYVVSKVGLTALSNIQQKEFDQKPHLNISVNAVHPGYVDTDMTSHKGHLTIEEGAKAPLFLALNAKLKGKYVWFDCRVVDWDGPAPQ
ncbi:unnamed protein product [Ceutorhynchus assimilis]|uniref:carbonyl reductase (NADPH) n=1 Tax=Ceutorhynchus assimilis TaxID=467358 RepID=A0A9N9MCF8_9CUCU|nr:unnamed protein product [Ceutorhynchus assimilis]